MIDLQVLAYQCDLTRVITFMVGREHSGMTYPQIGVNDAHHPISHYAGELQKIEKSPNQLVPVSSSRITSSGCRRRRTARPAARSHDMMYGAGIADSNSHDPYYVPIVLAAAAPGSEGAVTSVSRRAAREPPLTCSITSAW